MNTRALIALTIALLLAASGCGEDAIEKANSKVKPNEDRIIRVSGSDDVYPLVHILAQKFEKENTGYQVLFSPPTHTRGGAAGVSIGDVDIGLLSRPLTAKEKEGMPTYLHLAQDIVAFATHRGVSVKNLSRKQLLDIYSGKTTNWKEVGGKDAPITVLDRSEHTSIKIVLRHQLFGPSFKVTPSATVVERPEDMVTSIGMVENSIGYISMGDAILEGLNSNILSADDVEPSVSNFREGLYPYTRPFGFLIGPNPRKTTMKFIKFMYSEDGRQIMENHGFSPITMDLTIAVLPEQDLLAQEQRYGPLVDYLSQHLGLQITVKLKLLPNYGEVIKEFQAGRVNAAFLGSLAFALARAQAGVEPLVRPEKDGVSQYRGLIVTHRDSGIKELADLKGKSFGLVDKATTAGYIFPLLYFREHGIERPEEFLGSIVYTGSHDLLFLKVYNRELDAGAAKDLMLLEVAKTHPDITEELRVLAVSPPVPNNAFVLSGKLDFPCFHCHQLVPTLESPKAVPVPRQPDELKELLGDMLLKLHESPEGRGVLQALGADRFVKTTLEDLKEINKMLYKSGFDPKNYNP